MGADFDTLALIRTAFAGQRQAAERAFHDHDEFRSLCEDYYECVISLERWRQSASPEASLRQSEYSELLLELDREIQTWLEREVS